MLEIYNEQLRDSLDPKTSKTLKIKGDTEKGFFVSDLSKNSVNNLEELMENLNYGKKHRQVRSTNMNDYSSRSHSIFTIIVES